jgi:cysteinyl-tRNA synthetase
MHNGMIELDTKMSKSLGNIVALHAALEDVGRDALIMYFCGGHYRRPMPWRDDVLDDARARVKTFREAGRRLERGDSPEDMRPHRDAFFAALADDFNTPEALAAAHAWVNEANRREGVGDAHLREMLGVLALDNLLETVADAPAELVALAGEREAARAARDFATADRLRDELRDAGWEVRDGPSGPDLVPLA